MIQDNKKIPKKIKDILIQNPHWITNDLDLLNEIIDSENKKNTGNVVDLRDIFLKKTKSKFEKLSKIHTHTITSAYENFLGANNLHRCIIKILEQNKLNTTDTTVDVFKKLKKLEEIVLNSENLDEDINNHPRVISYLKENRDGSTWYGADVLITSNVSVEAIDWKRRSPSRSILLSKHAKPMAWLFITLSLIFKDQIDSVTKYFFYADLAQAANEQTKLSRGSIGYRDLMYYVIQASKRYL